MKQAQFLQVMSRDEAERRFRAALDPLVPVGVEVVSVSNALGRILAEDVASPVDVPGFDRSNVDGFAVRASDTFNASEAEPRRLRCLPGIVEMGRIPAVTVEAGTALAIPTGGAVPRGADAVAMVEFTSTEGDFVRVNKAVTPGRAITYAGTDIAQGEVVLRAKEALTSRETGVLAAIGLDRVAVFVRPVVAILSTGDEIVAAGEPLRAGAVYDSNAVILADAVREAGGEPLLLGIVPDDETLVHQAIRRALALAHVVLLSGGTSKGPGDINARVLVSALDPPGIVAHGVALKPGKPLCLAVSGGKPVVVLPGFPTSAIFTFHEFVAPVIRALAGRVSSNEETCSAALPFRVVSEAGRTEYVLVRLVENERAELVAYPIGKGSGSVTTFSQADGFFVIAEHQELVDAGERVTVFPIAGGRPRKVDLVVIGSHCVGLDVLLGRLALRGFSSKVIAVGSEAGLAAVRRGECDVAGCHLFDPATGSYNTAFLSPGLELVAGYGRMQGVVYRRGDKRFEGKEAASAVTEVCCEDGIVMINRNRGSGTRALVDQLLGDARPAGYGVEASSHRAVAAAVAQGRADFGVAIDIVAADRDLGFLTLCEEKFDFVVRTERLTRPAVVALVEELKSDATRAALRARGLRA